MKHTALLILALPLIATPTAHGVALQAGAARVDITEDPSLQGHYRCTLWLSLHGNGGVVESEIRLSTELLHLAA